jgi:SnoaL-like domain
MQRHRSTRLAARSGLGVPGALDDHVLFNVSVEKLADWLADKSRHRGAKQDCIANQLIEIVGDAAVCESYYFCYIEFTGDPQFEGRQDPTAVIMGGRYVDRLIRYQDEWRIASRTVLIDWSRNLGRPAP